MDTPRPAPGRAAGDTLDTAVEVPHPSPSARRQAKADGANGDGAANGDGGETADVTASAAAGRTAARSRLLADLLPPGTRAGRYMLLEPLGAGGAGQVYSAYDPQLDRKVAIKFLRAFGSDARSAQARLLREGQAMARLEHPNVLPVYDVGTLEHEGHSSVFIAMQRVEGGTLREWLKTRPSRRKILEVLSAAGRGLAAAHAAGLVHRDFKPDNVLISADEHVFVTDFGIVRAAATRDSDGGSAPTRTPRAPLQPLGAGREPSTPDLARDVDATGAAGVHDPLAAPLTADDTVVGTPAYMAPEQYLVKPVDARTDQFSFCVTLFEALTAERPFGGRSYEDIEQAAISGRMTPAAQRAELPAWLRRAVLKGLEPEPDGRHASMDALLAALADDPAIRRRRTLVAVGVLLLMAATTAGVARLSSRDRLLCRGGERKLAGVWDDGVRARLERSFAATGLPAAPRIAATVGSMIDDYARRWIGQYGDACEATRVRGEQPEAVLQLRMSCLDSRAHELRALTGMFAGADAALVQGSIDAVAALSSLSRCTDVAALTATIPPPDPATRHKVEELRAHLAQVRALVDAGRYPAGVEATSGILEAARALGYGPLVAEVLELRGSAVDGTGDHPVAESLFLEAFTTAFGAHHDVLAADSADDLAGLLGYWLARPAEARRWVAIALAAVRRLGGNDEVEAWIRRDEAWIDYQEGKTAAAVSNAERAVQLGKSAFGADHPRSGKIQDTLATMYMAVRRFDEAIAVSRGALAILQKAYGPDHENVGVSLISLGNAFSRQRRFAESEPYFRRALAIFDKALGEDNPTTVIGHINLAHALSGQKRFAEALHHAAPALAFAERRLDKEHPITANALLEVGQCQLGLDRAREALQSLERAAPLADKVDAETALQLRLALAQALWQSGTDRARAVALAEGVRRDAGAHGDREALVEAQTWLGAHTPLSPRRALDPGPR